MKKTKTRVKTPAKVLVCQSLEQVQEFIKQIGDTHRSIDRLQSDMNDEIAIITQKYADKINPLKQDSDELSAAVQIWCEANRDSLLTKGGKTANLITGEISWRMRPPSVVLRGTPDVIARLERFGLERFVRVKKEVNKDAILNEPNAIAGISGITVKTGVEDFIINPFEAEAT